MLLLFPVQNICFCLEEISCASFLFATESAFNECGSNKKDGSKEERIEAGKEGRHCNHQVKNKKIRLT